jgi:hypothetical protein
MAFLEYYRKEQQRHPDIAKKRISQKNIERILARFWQDYEVRPLPVEFRRGGCSWLLWDGEDRRIVYGRNRYVLVVLHELAHYLDIRKREGQMLLARTQVEKDRIARMRWHCNRHADLVDGLVLWWKHFFLTRS